MVGLEQFHARVALTKGRKEQLEADMRAFEVSPPADPAEAERRGVEFMIAHAVLKGRLLELEAWIEMLTAFPGVTRPDQLPRKDNTPKYEPAARLETQAQDWQEREGKHRRDALNLVAVLPDAAGGPARSGSG